MIECLKYYKIRIFLINSYNNKGMIVM